MAFQNSKPPARQGNQRQPQTENQQISFEASFKAFMDDLNRYRDQVASVLPNTVTFEQFRSVIVMAIRRTPDLLNCYGPSLINACLHAAHDGLMPDGREATIVVSSNKVPGTQNQWRKEASYRSMVYGLIQQILSSGAVHSVMPQVVYKGEHFRILGGTQHGIEHEIEPDGDKRGDILGVYAIARLKEGEPTFEYMTVSQIELVRKTAQTDSVWAKNWDEMAKKTVIRRLRKRLKGTRHLTDIEEKLMFPQYAPESAPAIPLAPPRPKRSDFNRIEHDENSSGVPMNFGGDGNPETRELVEKETERDSGKAASKERPREPEPDRQEKPAQGKREQAKEKPAEPAAKEEPGRDFAKWQKMLLEEIATLKTPVDVNSRWASEKQMIADAPDEIAGEIIEAFQDRLVDLTAGPSSADAGGNDGDDEPAGDQE